MHRQWDSSPNPAPVRSPTSTHSRHVNTPLPKKKKKVLSRDLNKDSSCKWETKEVADTFPHPLSSPTHVPHTCDTCACMSHGEMYSHTRVLQFKMNINCVSVWLRLIQTWNANAWNHGRLSLLEMEAGRFRVWVCEADFPLWILTLIIKKKKKRGKKSVMQWDANSERYYTFIHHNKQRSRRIQHEGRRHPLSVSSLGISELPSWPFKLCFSIFVWKAAQPFSSEKPCSSK